MTIAPSRHLKLHAFDSKAYSLDQSNFLFESRTPSRCSFRQRSKQSFWPIRASVSIESMGKSKRSFTLSLSGLKTVFFEPRIWWQSLKRMLLKLLNWLRQNSFLLTMDSCTFRVFCQRFQPLPKITHFSSLLKLHPKHKLLGFWHVLKWCNRYQFHCVRSYAHNLL